MKVRWPARWVARGRRVMEWLPWVVVAGVVCAVVGGWGFVRWRQGGVWWPVERFLGAPPPSLRAVHYDGRGSWLGLMVEPAYYLKFRADAEDVRRLLEREGFRRGGDSALWAVEEPWWAPDPKGSGLVHHERDRGKPNGCVVEHLWWDEGVGEVFYLLSCP